MSTELAVVNADPQREALCQRWLESAFADYVKETGDDEDIDLDAVVQFHVDKGRVPESGKEIVEYVNGVSEPETQGEVKTIDQCNAEWELAVSRIDKALHGVTDANYILSGAYLTAITARLSPNRQRIAAKAAPTKRSDAIAELADREMKFDVAEDIREGETFKQAMNRRTKETCRRIRDMVQIGAAMRLIFGAKPGYEIVNNKGLCVARSSKTAPAMAWRLASLFAPLVTRNSIDELANEEWVIIPGAEEAARAVHDQLFDKEPPSYSAVRERIAEIRKASLEAQAKAGNPYAKDELARIAEKEKKKEAPATDQKPAENTTPADAVKPTEEEQQARVEKEQDEPIDAEYSTDSLDAAQTAISAIEHATEPDTALELTVDALGDGKSVSKGTQRACAIFMAVSGDDANVGVEKAMQIMLTIPGLSEQTVKSLKCAIGLLHVKKAA